jgi:hypothetical protein
MSVIEELGTRVRAAADDLPVDLVAQALEHLRAATDRLRWVRQESIDPMGVPELSAAIEHAQSAGHALRVAREELAAYLTAIGLGAQGRPVPAPGAGDHAGAPRAAGGPAELTGGRPVAGWWARRVAELTGRDDPPTDRPAPAGDAKELLRRVARHARMADRTRLHAELRGVDAHVGVGLAAAAAPALRRLAGHLLGHPPRGQDLPRLRREVAGGLRDLLPGLPPTVLDTLLSRLCRTPPPKAGRRPHPADQAVAAGVLTGLLLRRLNADPPGLRDDDA